MHLAVAILLFFILASPIYASTVVINEFMPHPSSGNDWVELYNTTSSDVDLTGWSLFDNTSSMKSLSGTITAGGFITFEVSSRLNNSGDSVILQDSTSNTIDSYDYTSDPGTDLTYGRSPDGSSWTTLSSATKGTANPTPTPTPSSTATPTPSPSTAATSTPTPTPSPSAIATPTATPAAQSIVLSTIPSQITTNEQVTVSIIMLSFTANTKYYLKGAFVKNGSTNYFGITKVDDSWIKNNETYTKQYSITTDSSGNWTGSITVQPDSSDSGFGGSGAYLFKVGYYKSSTVSWSDVQGIFITEVASSTPVPVGGASPTPSVTAIASSSAILSSTNIGHIASSSAKTLSQIPQTILSAFLGKAQDKTPTSKVPITPSSSPNPLPQAALGLTMIAFASGTGLYFFKKDLLLHLTDKLIMTCKQTATLLHIF
jgi:hypothetical protein